MRRGYWRSVAAKDFEPGSVSLIPAAVLHADPLVSYSGILWKAPLGLASVGAEPLHERPAWFLLSPTWSIEYDFAENLHELAVVHRSGHRGHNLIFVCNTPEEAALLQQHDEAAFFYNKTANTSESIFRPLEDAQAEFDAIYNAQLVPWKRHELSLEIASCGFLFYRDATVQGRTDWDPSIIARHAAQAPGHVFINPFDEDGMPVRLVGSEVNRHLNRATVGLCLSEKEGAMFASTEYLLAGLPIVSTPSTGGRHVYYDEEYCWIVPPDPRSIANAVYALKAKAIPRAYIREKTLRRLEADRGRFLGLINSILEASGSARRLTMPWPFKKSVTMQWLPPEKAVSRAVRGVVDGFGGEKRGLQKWAGRLDALRRRCNSWVRPDVRV